MGIFDFMKPSPRNGQGTRTYPNGSKYVGEWKDGERHGQGTYTSGYNSHLTLMHR